MRINFKKFITWPSPLNVAVHLQRMDKHFANSSATVLFSEAESWRASDIRSLSQCKASHVDGSLVHQVLSVALDCAPEAVSILRHANGKPGILAQGIQFNVSHCQDWCAVAWCAESAVGVDVEVIRPVRNMEDIVGNFFPPIAQRAFQATVPHQKTQVFFHWWTQIAAALKASGGTLDDSYSCLDQVLQGTCDAVPGVALAVAAVGTGPLTITWHLP